MEKQGVNGLRNRALNRLLAAASCGPIGLEIMMALQSLKWALFMVVPASVLPNARGATMAAMASVAPVGLWLLAFLGAGLSQLIVAFSYRRGARWIVAVCGIFVWLFMASIDAFVGGFNAATVNLLLLALGQMGIVILIDILDVKE